MSRSVAGGGEDAIAVGLTDVVVRNCRCQRRSLAGTEGLTRPSSDPLRTICVVRDDDVVIDRRCRIRESDGRLKRFRASHTISLAPHLAGRSRRRHNHERTQPYEPEAIFKARLAGTSTAFIESQPSSDPRALTTHRPGVKAGSPLAGQSFKWKSRVHRPARVSVGMWCSRNPDRCALPMPRDVTSRRISF
jgi:hypothetical protein